MEQFKMNITDLNDRVIAHALLVAMEGESAVADIIIDPTSPDAAELEEGMYIKTVIFDNARGVRVYTGHIFYRLLYRVHIDKMRLVENVQRRNDVKLVLSDTEIPVVPIVETMVGESPSISKQMREQRFVKIRDISAGGIGLICNEKLDTDATYQMDFTYGMRPLVLRFTILRITEMSDGTLMHGCQFENLPLKDEMVIRQYIFKALAEQYQGYKF